MEDKPERHPLFNLDPGTRDHTLREDPTSPNALEQSLPGDTSSFKLAGEKDFTLKRERAEGPLVAPLGPEPERAECSQCKTRWSLEYLSEFRGRQLCPTCLGQVQDGLSKAERSAEEMRTLKTRLTVSALILAVVVGGNILTGQSAAASKTWSMVLGSLAALAGLYLIILGYVRMLRSAFILDSKLWGGLVLASPLFNLAVLYFIGGTLTYKTGTTLFQFLTRDALWSMLMVLCPVGLLIYAIWKWAEAKSGFIPYAAGLCCFAMAFYGGPRGKSLSLGDWISADGRVALQLGAYGKIFSLVDKSAGKIRFTSDCTATIEGFPVFSGASYDREKDELTLTYWAKVDQGTPKEKALLKLRLFRPSPELRDKVTKWEGDLVHRMGRH